MSDLDVETSKNPRDFLGESFGIEQNNHTALVRITHFLLSVSLVTIVDEIGRVIISGKGFCYSLSFSCSFLFGGWDILCAIHEGTYDRVFMLGVVMRFEVKVAVGVGSFPVYRHGDRAIVLSGCSCVKKGNRTF